MTMETVRIKNLCVFHAEQQSAQKDMQAPLCVNKLSFSLKAGETLALVGKNGAGKSLTIMAIMDALPPRLQWDAEECFVAGGRPALIMQNAADCFDPLFTVNHIFWETLPSFFTKAMRARAARQLLDEVRLPHHVLDLYPFELSGGMVHRLMLALALTPIILPVSGDIQPSRLLLADEPLAGLDAPAKAHFVRRVAELQTKYNFSMIYIDHNFAAVRELAHKMIVLHEGRVVEYGETKRLLQEPQHEVTQELVRAAHSHNLEYLASSVASQDICTKIDNVAEPVLHCQFVSKSYAIRSSWGQKRRKKIVLSDVTLQLRRGEGLGLVGMNGAGKSTLMRVLLGLEACDAGMITIFGKPLSEQLKNVSWRSRIQPVFQHARMAVNARMTVKSILQEPLLAHGFCRSAQEERIEELLDLVELSPRCECRLPSQLSGGQLQRLCFARSLALKPDILLLDEAFTDMDATTKMHLQGLLLSLQHAHGLSYICISHDLQTLLRLCHHIALLHDGRIVDSFPRGCF